MNYIDTLEKEHEDSIKKPSPHELVEDFKPTKTMLKNVKKALYDRLDEVRQIKKDIDNGIDLQDISYGESENIKMLLHGIYMNPMEEDIKQKIKENESLTKIIENKSRPKSKKFEELDKDLARERPISDFIQFNRQGKAPCIFHKDGRTPNMHYFKKTNTVKCFSGQCSIDKAQDVISVVQKLYDTDFIGALKIILNK